MADPLPFPAAPQLFPLAELLAAVEADYAEAWEARQAGRPRGAVTGFPALDAELGGHLAEGVHVVHGGPGSGKTAWCLQVAATCGAPALFVSTEMGAAELFRRLVARVTGTYLGRLRAAEIPPDLASELFHRTAAACSQVVICDATTAPAPPDWLAVALAQARGTAPHAVLIADSLHSWAASLAPSELGEYDSLNMAMADLRALAVEGRCAVIVTAERNRASMQAGGMHAGAGTRRIEYAADTMFELSREADAMPDAGGEVPVNLKVSKNRHGTAGRTYPLRFHGACQRFTAPPS